MKTIVYTTKSCPYCVKVKRWLDDHEVQFNEVRIDKNPAEMLAMIDKTAQTSVPCTIVRSKGDKKIIFGFDESKLVAAFVVVSVLAGAL